MPNSSIAMATFDGDYTFDINEYLCKNYQTNLPARRAICSKFRDEFDEEDLINQLDAIVREHALNTVGWSLPEEKEDDEE